MSTNYYIIPTEFIDAGVSLHWAKMVHIAQSTHSGFLLQAVRGADPFKSIRDAEASAFYYADIDGFPTLESWAEIRDVVMDPYYTVIDEYHSVVQKNFFVNSVEQNKNGISARYDESVKFRQDNTHLAFAENYCVLDNDGYAIDYREFF